MAEVRIRFEGDPDDAVRAAKDVDKALDRVGSTGKRTGTSFKTIAAGVFAGGGMLAALEGVSRVARGAWDEFAEGEKVAAQTAAVLKSTGGAANVTATGVSDLATELMRLSGVDDEAIASGENLLLTFTNIRNEVGKGNDVFDQATRLMLDMSVALGQDTSSSAIQLGKALNDPVKGVTALQRVGVSFTKAQRDQIKALVESGDTMKAQKLILAELTREFGGSAKAAGETLPGQINIAKETLNNFAGDIVARVVPAVAQAVSWLKDNWPEIQARIQEFWASAQPILVGLRDLLVAMWPVAQKALETFLPILRQAAAVLADVIRLVTALIQGDWSRAWQLFKDVAVGWINLLKTEILVAFGLIKDLALAAVNLLRQGVENALRALVAFVGDRVDDLVGFFRALPGRLLALLGLLVSTALAPYRQAFAAVKSYVGDQVDALVAFFAGLPGRIAGTLGALAGQAINPLRALFAKVGDAIDKIRDGIVWLKDNAAKVLGTVADALAGPLGALASFLRPVADLLGSIIRAVDGIIARAGDVAAALGKISSVAGGILGALPGRAGGGPVTAGQAYIVGEKGPELLVPSTNGTIVPNSALATPRATTTGGGATLVVNVQGDFVGERFWVERLATLIKPQLARVAMYESRA